MGRLTDKINSQPLRRKVPMNAHGAEQEVARAFEITSQAVQVGIEQPALPLAYLAAR